jgi:hypothetical protein
MFNKSPESGSGQARKSKRTQNVPRIMFARSRLVKLQEIAWLGLNPDGNSPPDDEMTSRLQGFWVTQRFPRFHLPRALF